MLFAAGFASQIVLDERDDLAMVLLAPAGAVLRTNRTEIYRVSNEILRDRSLYRLRTYDGNQEVEACRGNIGCLALAARTGPSAPRFLIILSVRPSEDSDLLRLLLIDTDVVARVRYERPELVGEEFEDEIFGQAVIAQPATLEARDNGDLPYVLKDLLVDRLGWRIFEGHAITAASIEISARTEGIGISLDGRLIGATRAGKTLIEGARPGSRKLSLSHPALLPEEFDIALVSKQKLKVRMIETPVVGPSVSSGRSTLMWVGAGSVAAGMLVGGYALIAASSNERGVVCVRGAGNGDGCPAAMFVDFGGQSELDLLERPKSGLGIAPVAFGLFAAGATWFLTTWLGDQAEVPWIEISLGILAGVGTLAATAALE